MSRSFWAGILDRVVGWALGLPAESCTYAAQAIMIPLPDGTALASDLYRPIDCEPIGTILVRGPYGRGIFFSLILARVFAARRYQVLFVSSRGTFGSTGAFDAGRSEADDGQNIVAWLRAQPWYTGTFATMGSSYLGFTQWALLSDPPLDMVAAIIIVAPHDFAERIWGTGSFSMLQHVLWSDTIVNQETRGLWQQMMMMKDPSRLYPLMKSVPLEPALRRHFGDEAPWLFHNIKHRDLNDATWASLKHGNALNKANIPILLITGWHDIFFEQTMEQYHALNQRGCPVALRVGPGGHMDAQGAGDTTRESLKWFDAHLARNTSNQKFPAVRVHRCGDASEWLVLPNWPPPTTRQRFFLSTGGKLGHRLPSTADTSSFTFDPSDPTPTVGGSIMIGGGSVNDTALCNRPDVITFTSEPLTKPLDILGPPSVNLFHSSDNPFCDLFIRLSVVDARGRSRNITEQYRRIEGSREPRLIALEIPDTAYRIPIGSKIRLIVAGGCFPKQSFNLGTGEDPATGTTMRPARHTVHYGDGNVSCLILPVSEE